MSIIANAKAKAAKGNVKEAFKNEEGAIDLASIMVGIIVIGLIGGVIAATVFAVIPWAQDNAAKQQLDSIAAAQSAYVGLVADKNGAATTFGTEAELKAQNLFNGESISDLSIQKTGTGTGAHYAAVVKSSSGNWFKITDANTKPQNIGTKSASGADAEGGSAYTEASFNSYNAIIGAS